MEASPGESPTFSIGQRVEVSGRDLVGTIAFMGTTSFAAGKWVGLVLDEPRGKNNGTFQGTFYFEAQDNHGLFVRQSQLLHLDPSSGTTSGRKTLIPGLATKTTPPKTTPEDSKLTKPSRSRIPGFGFKTATAPSQSTKAFALSSSLNNFDTSPAPAPLRFEPASSSKFIGCPTSKSPASKTKGSVSVFSKLSNKTPKTSTATYTLPGPSKSFSSESGSQTESKINRIRLPKHPTFTSTSTSSSKISPLPTVMSKLVTYSNGTPTRIVPARSSPQLNAAASASKGRFVPFQFMGDYRGSKRSSPSLISNGFQSSSFICNHSKAHSSQGNLIQTSTPHDVATGERSRTPPPKPPRNSINSNTPRPIAASATELNQRNALLSQAESTTIVKSGIDDVDDDSSPSPGLVGIFSKRRRRISELKHSPSLASQNRATEYRICKKLEAASRLTQPRLRLNSCTSISSSSSTTVVTPRLSNSETKSRTTATTISRFSFFKRLPIAGGPKDSGKSLHTSPSGSKSNLTTPTSAVSSKPDLSSTKRQAFVETIAEPIVPQYTQGPLYTPTMTPSNAGPEDRFGAIHNAEALRNEVRDLNEKLDVLKAKRAADQEKLREIDRLRLQVETLSEFKTKVLESQAALQKEVKKAKQDARDAIAAKDQHAEELSDLSEAVEMATLDKEMAEEKAETLQLELEQSNEKIAQLTTELAAIKDEISGNVDPELQAANSIQVKQLQGENSRLREAVLKLRDSGAHDKHQHQKLLKEVEIHKVEVAELSKIKERLQTQCDELESQVTDLQEMNDAALGAEEMVVNLTEKNLNLEEKVSQLAEAVADLEALQDVNDQLQESAKELEMELREELQQAVVANSNMVREKEALIETLGDREATIVRFRELVQKLRDENDILRKNLEAESTKSLPVLPEALDFKKIFAETKAQTTAIDLELRRLEAKEASLHADYLSSFMPEGFMKRGGDNDAIRVLLLVPRMICKVELLLSQVKDKLIPTSLADVAQPIENIASSADVEIYAFSCQFSFLLHALLGELHRWSTALNSCSTDDFLKVGLLITELSIQERAVDFYLELLRKSQLDENIPLDALEKCISSFQNFYANHLGEEQSVPATLVSDLCLASAAASDCLIVDVARLIHMLKKNESDSNVAALLQDVKTIGESLRQLAKRTRRYLPDPPKQPPVSNKLQSQLLNDAVTLTKVVKVFQEACKQSVHHAGMASTEGDVISSAKVEEYFQSAMEKCDTRVEGAGGFKEAVKEWLTTALMTMTDLAQVVNEAPIHPKEKPPTPLSLRSQAVKAELDQARNLKIQLEDKEAAMNDLRKLVRSKQEELSEATIRKELAEKKLSNATKDSEMTIEKLTRKLEDLQTTLQRKEREFQATLEHFQAEIDEIENEKGELKEKLMTASKRRLIEGIAQSAASSPAASPAHGMAVPQTLVPQFSTMGGGEFTPSTGLMEYTRFLQRENWRLKSQKVLDIVKGLKPLNLPKKEHYDSVRQLEKEYWKLKHESNSLLCQSLKVALDKELTSARKQYMLRMINAKKSELSPRIIDLKNRIASLMAERKEFGVIKSDFAVFLPEQANQNDSADTTVPVGMIRFPGWEKSSEKPKRIVLSREQLHEVHRLLDPI